uniref:Uncharacterized protein n=1 Tax=Ixodes ricinus TaxID=34613 RepID=A0A6B0V2X5_IXORI
MAVRVFTSRGWRKAGRRHATASSAWATGSSPSTASTWTACATTRRWPCSRGWSALCGSSCSAKKWCFGTPRRRPPGGPAHLPRRARQRRRPRAPLAGASTHPLRTWPTGRPTWEGTGVLASAPALYPQARRRLRRTGVLPGLRRRTPSTRSCRACATTRRRWARRSRRLPTRVSHTSPTRFPAPAGTPLCPAWPRATSPQSPSTPTAATT